MSTPAIVSRPGRYPMTRNALAELRQHPRRIVAVVVAIMISVAFLIASVTVVASEGATIERGIIARTAHTDVVVTVAASDPTEQANLVERVRKVQGVATADLTYLSHGRVTGSADWLQQQSVLSNPRLRWTELARGRWPATPDEIVLGTVTARQLNLGIGDRTTINDSDSSATLTVTGLVHEDNSLLSGLAQASFVDPSFYSAADTIHTSLQTEIHVIGTGDVPTDRLAERIRTVASDSRVETSSVFGRRKLTENTSGMYILQILLLVFGAIALLVGAIMIVNTFLILITQRRRQIGLLRAVGASQAQIRRSLLVEASAVGVVGSLLGLGLGLGVAATVAAAIGERLTVPVGQVGVLAVVGTAVAVGSGLLSARRANRITPLEALRVVDDHATERRTTIVRRSASLALCAAGLAAICFGFGNSPHALLYSVGGSFITAVGLLSAIGLFLPWLLRLFSRLIAAAGPTARLASNNTLRNPGRVAATATALVLAVGLIVTLQVGAASMKATANSNLHTRFPVDVTVSMFKGSLPDRTLADISGIAGIAKSVGVRSTRVTFDTDTKTKPTALRVLGPDPDALSLLSVPRGPTADGVILADPFLLRERGIRDNSAATLTGPTGSVTLPVKGDYLAPADSLVVAPTVLRTLDEGAPVGAVWAQTRPGADITELRSALRTVAAPITGAEVNGGLSAKASYNELLDRLLLMTTMLLAVAVLIALVGVGNTLGLSVLERTRESALLRALGLQSRQLRWMLAVEAILLSLAGTTVGTAAGMFFGWIGTHAISGELNFHTVRFAVSLPQTAAVAVTAIAAGIVASVLPGRHAARAAPMDALADR
jgi:putative ABC transport system permease protein